jgi:hypothetical protein
MRRLSSIFIGTPSTRLLPDNHTVKTGFSGKGYAKNKNPGFTRQMRRLLNAGRPQGERKVAWGRPIPRKG